MKTLYKPNLSLYDNEDLKELKAGRGIECCESRDIYFSSMEKALEFLRTEIEELDDEHIAQITIREIPVDSEDSDFTLHFYDSKLNYLGVFNHDKTYKKAKYKKGSWILFHYNGSIQCGYIAEECENQEPYLVIFEDSNLSDCSPHAHMDELMVVQVISEKEASNLLPRKYFENILRRVKLSNH